MKRVLSCVLIFLLLLSLLTAPLPVNVGAEKDRATLSGLLTSYGDGVAKMELLPVDKIAPAAILTVCDGRYTLTVSPGSYILNLSKMGNVTRTQPVTLMDGNNLLNIALHLPGDLNGDGRINMADVSIAYAHCRQTALLTDDYLVRCADYNGDGNVSMGDVAKLYASLRSKPLGATPEVPSYVKREAERVAALALSKATTNRLVFAALSDIHHPYDDEFDGTANTAQAVRDAGRGIAELRKSLPLDFIGFFGDYVLGGKDSTVAESKAALRFVSNAMYDAGRGIQQIWLQGNHDRNPYDTDDGDLTPEELYTHIFSHNSGTVVASDHPQGGYGYKDYDREKIRVIYWNSSETAGVETVTDHCFTADQYHWMAEVAFDLGDKEAPAEWGIVMLSHMPANWTPQMRNFVDAYISGKKVTVKAADNEKVTVNFAGRNQAEFICAINGHTHNFRASRVGKNKFWQIAVPQVCAGRYNEYGTSWPTEGGELDAQGNPVYHIKIANSARSTSFCVFVVDRENRKIHALHYGAGIDREFDY